MRYFTCVYFMQSKYFQKYLVIWFLFPADKKLFGAGANYNREQPISRLKLCKQNLYDQNFTFWEWFFAIRKLTHDHLRGLWCNNRIVGFISKPDAENILRGCAPGTFLLRFCDSMLNSDDKDSGHKDAGVSIVLVNNNMKFTHAEPIFYTPLNTKSISLHVNDMDKCVYLYPGTPKVEAFGPPKPPASKFSKI